MLPIVWCLYGCVVNALSKMISGSRPNGWFSKRIRRSSFTTSTLGLELLLAHLERRHAVGLEPEHERQVLRRHRLPVDRRVFVGEGVGLAADARDPRRMLIGPHVPRALEHQVLEQMREAGAARLLVLRSDVVPERRGARSASSGLRGTRPAARSAAWSSCSRTWSGADDRVRPPSPASSDDDAGERPATRTSQLCEACPRLCHVRSLERPFERRQPGFEVGERFAADSGSRRDEHRQTRAIRRRRRPECRRRAAPAAMSFVTADFAPTIDAAARAARGRWRRTGPPSSRRLRAPCCRRCRPARPAARCGRSSRRARPARGCRSSCRRRSASRRRPADRPSSCAPISTSSSITTRPTCGIFRWRAVARGARSRSRRCRSPRRPGARRDAPIATPSRIDDAARGWSQSSPIDRSGADDDVRVRSIVRAPMRARGADRRRTARSRRPAPSSAVGSIAASGLMPGAGRRGGVSSATASANAR